MSHALFLYTYSSSSPVVYKEDSAGLCSSVILSQTEDLSLCSLQPSRFRVHQVVTHVGGHKDAVVAHIAVVDDGETFVAKDKHLNSVEDVVVLGGPYKVFLHLLCSQMI